MFKQNFIWIERKFSLSYWQNEKLVLFHSVHLRFRLLSKVKKRFLKTHSNFHSSILYAYGMGLPAKFVWLNKPVKRAWQGKLHFLQAPLDCSFLKMTYLLNSTFQQFENEFLLKMQKSVHRRENTASYVIFNYRAFWLIHSLVGSIFFCK